MLTLLTRLFGSRNDRIVKGYEATAWYGLGAPRQTPKPVVDKLNREISAIVESPEIKEKLKGQGVETDAMKPDELASLYQTETAKWAKVIRDSKVASE